MLEMEYTNREDVIGKSFVNFIHESQKELFPDRFEQFKEEGTVSGIEWKVITNLGNVKVIRLDGKIRFVNGVPERSFCVYSNITEEKKAESW